LTNLLFSILVGSLGFYISHGGQRNVSDVIQGYPGNEPPKPFAHKDDGAFWVVTCWHNSISRRNYRGCEYK